MLRDLGLLHGVFDHCLDQIRSGDGGWSGDKEKDGENQGQRSSNSKFLDLTKAHVGSQGLILVFICIYL